MLSQLNTSVYKHDEKVAYFHIFTQLLCAVCDRFTPRAFIWVRWFCSCGTVVRSYRSDLHSSEVAAEDSALH